MPPKERKSVKPRKSQKAESSNEPNADVIEKSEKELPEKTGAKPRKSGKKLDDELTNVEKSEKRGTKVRASKDVRKSRISKAAPTKKAVQILEPPPPAEPINEAEISVNDDLSLSEEGEEEYEEIHFDDIEALVEEFDEQPDSDHESDTVDESEEEDEFAAMALKIYDDNVRLEQNFLETFGRIPDIDQISIDSSIKRFMLKLEGIDATDIDKSKDAIADEEEEGEGEEGEGAEVKVKVEQKKEIEKTGATGATGGTEATGGTGGTEGTAIVEESSSEMSFVFESSSEEEELTTEKHGFQRDLFGNLVDEDEIPFFEEFIDFSLLARQAEERQLDEDTKAFLRKLIDHVVDVAEYIDPKEVLRENLDKVKLFKALVKGMCEAIVENKVNVFVNRMVRDYLKRQKNFVAITPESSVEIFKENKRRYEEALDELNNVLGRYGKAAEISLNKQMEFEEKEELAKIEVEHELENLRHLIHTTFAKRGSEHLNAFVEKRIREMSAMRREISEARSMLIAQQHEMARLNEKKAALEFIAPNLYLSDYEHLQTEVYTLGVKIEEKNDHLERFRNQFNGGINTLAHINEKKDIMQHLIDRKRVTYRQYIGERNALRAIIHNLKTDRIRVQKQIREISFQCGLIDKPALCIDYDQTLDRCIELRAIVSELKEDVITKEKKIDYYNAKCERKLGSSSGGGSQSRTSSKVVEKAERNIYL